jgi:diguanylate cyclase (GGDEF)-like protein/PAS domain S-box-containing protein/putative nucleotidyltransferase with HDIG domain
MILLFGLVFLINLSDTKINQNSKLYKVILGLFIGAITVIIMINAWEMKPGIFFDTRTVMISVSTFFFPLTTSVIALIVASIYRGILGGPGVYAGILSMVSAFAVGKIWKRYIHQRLPYSNALKYYLYGIAVHIFMLISQFAVQTDSPFEIIREIGLIIMITYPIAVMLLSLALDNHDKRISSKLDLEMSEKNYRSLINDSSIGIIKYNHEGIIELANESFAKLLDTDVSKLISLNMTQLENVKLVNHLKLSLLGENTIFEGEYKSVLSGKKVFVRVQFSPLIDNDEVIGGVGYIQDLTKEYQTREQLETIKQHDILTKLYNRSAFDAYLLKAHHPNDQFPLCIATCDINSFQLINTSFGYDIGNDVLVTISETIRYATRTIPNVKIYRIGGDEFAVIFPNTSLDKAQSYTKDIIDELNHRNVFSFDISISFGYGIANSRSIPLSSVFNEALSEMQKSKIYEGASLSLKTIDIIMTTLFEKSAREQLHSKRVSVIAKEIATQFNLGEAFNNRVELAGKLHDIGKINISEDILDKPAKLNDNEWDRIKKHPESGFKILSAVPEYLDIANIVYTHHEWVDGSGYPRGLSKKRIPLEARIISVADAYDAMTQQRTYRNPLSHKEAIQEIIAYTGKQFDPEVVDAFLKC